MRHAVVLDFDGTLADTMPQLTELGVDVLTKHYGLPLDKARDYFLETVGEPFHQQLQALFHGDSRNHTAGEEFRTRKREIFDDARPFDDVDDALRHLVY
ncbi:hypothetical protein LCGC14_1698970, partial [marine sediment metagenome]